MKRPFYNACKSNAFFYGVGGRQAYLMVRDNHWQWEFATLPAFMGIFWERVEGEEYGRKREEMDGR